MGIDPDAHHEAAEDLDDNLCRRQPVAVQVAQRLQIGVAALNQQSGARLAIARMRLRELDAGQAFELD